MDPDKWEEVETKDCANGVMVSNLPLLFAHGSLTTLEQMSLAELEEFVPFMVRCSVNEDLNTPWSQLPRPGWWLTRLPYRIPSLPKHSVTKNILIKLVSRCYAFHGCDYLIKFCATLHQMRPSVGFRMTDNRDGTTSMFDGSTGKLLVTFRNENRDYDKAKAKSKQQLSSQKKLLASPNHHNSSNSHGGNHKNGMVQPPVLDVFLCDKCDDEFQSFKEVQTHEKVCKGYRPYSPHLPSPEPEEKFDEREHKEQVPFLFRLGLNTSRSSGLAPYTSPTKKSTRPVKKSLPQNYLRFDSIDVCSPLGRYILTHCKYRGKLQTPEHFVWKYEKHVRAQPGSDVAYTRERLAALQRWSVIWRPRSDEQPWAHSYGFTSADRKEKATTIHTESKQNAEPCPTLEHDISSRNQEFHTSHLNIDNEVSVRCDDSIYDDDNYTEENSPSDKLNEFINEIFANGENGLEYLKQLMGSHQSNIFHNQINPEDKIGFLQDLYHFIKKTQSCSFFNTELDEAAKESISSRDMKQLLSDECRELKLKGLRILGQLDPKKMVVTRCVAGKAIESIKSSLPSMLDINFNHEANFKHSENNSTSTVKNHLKLFPGSSKKRVSKFNPFLSHNSIENNAKLSKKMAKIYRRRCFSESSVKENLFSNLEFLPCVEELDNSERKNELKVKNGKKKMCRELLNIIQDECKELKEKGFHPSDVLSAGNSAIQCLNATREHPQKRRRHFSLMSFENLNDFADDLSNYHSKEKLKKTKLCRELVNIARDECKELKEMGFHPSDILKSEGCNTHYLNSAEDQSFPKGNDELFNSSLNDSSNPFPHIYGNKLSHNQFEEKSKKTKICRELLNITKDECKELKLMGFHPSDILKSADADNQYVDSNEDRSSKRKHRLSLLSFNKSGLIHNQLPVNNEDFSDEQPEEEKSKKTKLCRELLNITKDECKELKLMGFHPSDILNSTNSTNQYTDEDHSLKLKDRISLLSFKKFEDIPKEVNVSCDDLSHQQLVEKLKKTKISRELLNITKDECKELKLMGFHPSDIINSTDTTNQSLDTLQNQSSKSRHRLSLLSFKNTGDILNEPNDFNQVFSHQQQPGETMKKTKLCRELLNITKDECKELKLMGFHPSDILDCDNSPPPYLNAVENRSLLKRKNRLSLLSFDKSSSNDVHPIPDDTSCDTSYYQPKDSNNNKIARACQDANVAELIRSNKRLSKELANLMMDEWKEMKTSGSHPSQINNLMTLQRTFRSSHLNSKGFRNHLKIARFSKGNHRPIQETTPTPRMVHRELLNSDEGMCVLRYSYDPQQSSFKH